MSKITPYIFQSKRIHEGVFFTCKVYSLHVRIHEGAEGDIFLQLSLIALIYQLNKVT